MKKISKAIKLAAAVCIGGLTLVSCSSGGGSGSSAESLDEMDPITITVADVDPESGAVGRAWTAFAEEVEEKSEGKIKVETYLSDSLFTHDETLRSVGSGTAHLSRLSPNLTPDELPVINWYMKFGSMPSTSFPHGLLQASGVAAEIDTDLPEIVEELDQHNLVPLGGAAIAQEYSLLCNKEVKSVEDLKGMRVRTGGEPWTSELKSLGMVPTSLISPEAYEALQRGTIECTTADTYQFVNYGFTEVAQYYVPLHMTPPLNNVYVVNKDLWEDLPAEGQEILSTAMKNLWESIMDSYTDAYADFADEVEKRNITVVDATDMNNVLAKHQDKVGGQLADIAPKSVEDPEGTVEKIQQLSDEWLEAVVETTGVEPKDRDYGTLMEDYKAVRDIDLSKYNQFAEDRVFSQLAD